MRGIWRKCLALTASLLAVAAQAGEPATLAVHDPRVIARSAPEVVPVTAAPAVTLGKPAVAPRVVDPSLEPAAFAELARPIVRARSDEIPMPPAAPEIAPAPTPFAESGPEVISEGPPPMPMGMGAPMGMSYPAGMPIDPDMYAFGDGISHQFTNVFFVDAEYLLWTLKGQQLPPLATSSFLASPTIGTLSTQVEIGDNEQDVGLQQGFRIHAGVWFGQDHAIGLEGSYFFLAKGSETFSTASRGLPILGIPFLDANGNEDSIPLTLGATAGTSAAIEAELQSRLWGAEANIRMNCKRGMCSYLDLIVGFRCLGLDDNFRYTTVQESVGATRTVTEDQFNSRNRFYGGQIGAIYNRQHGRWSFEMSSKVGVGGNSQEVEITGNGFLTGPNNLGSFDRTRLAFVAESGLKVGYQLTDRVRMTAGYNFLYLTNAVRGAEQIDRALVGVGRPAFSFNESNFWAHGLTVGLEMRY